MLSALLSVFLWLIWLCKNPLIQF